MIPVSDIKVTETDQILLLLVLCTLEKDVAQNVIASVFTPISPGERQDVRLEKPRFAKDRLNLIAVETHFHKKPFYFQVDFFLGKLARNGYKKINYSAERIFPGSRSRGRGYVDTRTQKGSTTTRAEAGTGTTENF